MPTTKQTERKPRYKRAKVRPFQLQERDIDIIRAVYKHRFLTSEHISALLDGKSKQSTLRRLQLLYHAGFLDRPREQIKPYQEIAGSAPMAYGLGNKGAALLVERFNIPRAKTDWTSKNREVKTVFLEHTLSIANFMVCLEIACRGREDVRFVEAGEFIKEPPVTWTFTKTMKDEKTGESKKYKYGIVPDNCFALHYPKTNETDYVFLEVDRSTMPIYSNNFFRSSVYKKFWLYWESWQADLFKQHFGFENARVITLAKSKQRIENMIKAVKEVDDRKKGSRMFLFALESIFTPAYTRDEKGKKQRGSFEETAKKALDNIWQNGKDTEILSLID